MEIKILNVDPNKISEQIISLGAHKVFDEDRIITYFKNINKPNEISSFKLTEEGKLKFSASSKLASEEIKVFVSRKEEFVKILELMDYTPVTRVVARRISFELESIDFDIDIFPGIFPFLELDVPADNPLSRNEVIKKLNLQNNQLVNLSTPEIFTLYGKDYFTEFKLR